MKLYHKIVKANGAEMYLVYPSGQRRTPFKRRSITVLTDDCTPEGIRSLTDRLGLETLAAEKEIILCFPVATDGPWDKLPLPTLRARYDAWQDGMTKPDDEPLARNEIGIPTAEAMTSTWHPMNDTKYLIGVGSGATAALTLASCMPANVAAVLAQGGSLPQGAERAESPVPVCLFDASDGAVSYFRRVNGDDRQTRLDGYTVCSAARHPWQMTVLPPVGAELDALAMRWVWERLFAPVRRTNTCPHGDVEPSMDISKVPFEYFIEDTRLPDGLPHTWFVHRPARKGCGRDGLYPLVMFFHGASDNPAEAAEMSKLHELGEREGFITVYPWGTNRCTWNSAMSPAEADDAGFLDSLIDDMLAHYPIDRERVYLSGFSNGAAMAQTVVLLHPDKVAALFHIDSNWPGRYGGYQPVTAEDVTPFRLGFERKKDFDYRMPVWYTYGSRELSYPVFRDSTQQNQYDLWKRYNHVPIRETPRVGEPNPTGCGVAGDIQEELRPSERHPDHRYQVQRFYSDDPQPLNLYNFVVMHDKGHEIAQMDAELGWRYARQFRRLADGSLAMDEQH